MIPKEADRHFQSLLRAFELVQKKALNVKEETIMIKSRAAIVSRLEKTLRPFTIGRKVSEIDRMLRKESSMKRMEERRQKKELEVQAFKNLLIRGEPRVRRRAKQSRAKRGAR